MRGKIPSLLCCHLCLSHYRIPLLSHTVPSHSQAGHPPDESAQWHVDSLMYIRGTEEVFDIIFMNKSETRSWQSVFFGGGGGELREVRLHASFGEKTFHHLFKMYITSNSVQLHPL